jgi:phosphopantetheinyl transferase
MASAGITRESWSRDPDAYVSSLWSSKEALAKALGDPLHYDPRRLESPMSWPGGRAGPWRAARLATPDGHTAWLCWRPA